MNFGKIFRRAFSKTFQTFIYSILDIARRNFPSVFDVSKWSLRIALSANLSESRTQFLVSMSPVREHGSEFFWLHFPSFELNEISRVVQSKCGNLQTRKAQNTGTLYSVEFIVFSWFFLKSGWQYSLMIF